MGDIERVVIGDCTLYRGDCREVLPMLGPVDAVVTDPPYGVGLRTKNSDYRHSRYYDAGASLQASHVYLDTEERIKALIRETMPMILKVCACALVFPGARLLFEYPRPMAIGGIYTPSGAGQSAWGFQCMHPILYYGKDPYLVRGLGSRPNSFETVQPQKDTIDHPCPKPLAWMTWATRRVSFPQECIVDPFMGSGTTGVACAQLGRKFIGIEIEEQYFAIACRRIEAAYAQPRLPLAERRTPVQQSLLEIS